MTLLPRTAHASLARLVVVALASLAITAPEAHGATAAPATAGAVRAVTPPNLLVILIDAQRADHLSSYGYARRTSPGIDAFAERGARFTRAVSVSNRTGTSMASMWTGLLPSRHGVFRTGDVLDERFTTLAELLRARGYRSAAWCPNPSLDRSFGHAQGWDAYDDDVLTRVDGDTREPWRRWETASAINERALRWIAADPAKPFLAWLHYRDVHGPYVPPPPWDRAFPPLGKRPLTAAEIAARPPYLTLPDDGDDLQHYLAQYDGDVGYTDQRVAELLADLERRGLLRNTVVVITADHGEAFLEHGQWNHDASLYEEEVHIPLIVVQPGGSGRVVENVVSSLDLFPTLLALAGAPTSSSDGESLLPLLAGDPSGYRREQAFAESRASWRRVQRAVRDGKWKLIARDRPAAFLLGSSLELYDLAADPREQRDLAAVEPERAAAMAAALRDTLARPAVALQPPAARPAVDAGLQQRLEALGYVD